MRIQWCPDCSDAWDPVECNANDGRAERRPAEETPNDSTQIEPKLVPRSTLELVARIIGPSSAAAKTLAHADRLGGDVDFWDANGVWLVSKRKGNQDAQV